MNASEKILKAKVQLILEQPFFATLALKMQYVPDARIETASTDGRCLTYNPSYFDPMNIDEVKGVIAHEIMHTAMLHHTRRSNRDLKIWNQATDYAINPLLIESGFVLPAGYLINELYENKSAEQIYNMLPAPSPEDGENSDQPGGTGAVKDIPANTSLQEAEAEMKQTLAQAALIAKRQGKLPAHLERFVNEVLQSRIDWREALARFLTEINRNDYTWSKPSARYLHCGLYLPSSESLEVGKLILIVDTSASIDDKMINQFASEVQDITNTFHISLQMIYVDTEVQSVQDVEYNEPIKLQPKGGGGTDFRPGFDFIDHYNLAPKAVVYLTDGECNNFPAPPDYPVLWAQFGDAAFTPPFGETIQVAWSNPY